jgi:pimeloyl-ACP methyl ester carboxylesterase
MRQARDEDAGKVGRFRTTEGQARFERAYDAALADWPTAPSPIELPTRFGITRVNACGAPDTTPIVLLHGMMMTSASWLPNVGDLGERHRLFAVDTICDAGRSIQARRVRGGDDLASWLDEVLDGLGLARAHLVGLSYGAWLAINQALRSPERLAGITAIEPPGVITRGKLKLVAEMVRAGVHRSDRALDRLTRILGGGDLPPEPIFEVLGCAFRDYKVVQPFAELLDDAQLRSIDTPVLLMFGELSPMSDANRAVRRAHDLIPDVQTEIVPGTAHTPPIEKPDLVDQLILDFIGRVDGPEA